MNEKIKQVDYSRPDMQPPMITKAQAAVLQMMTDQRCADWVDTIDFYNELPAPTKAMLKTAEPETIEWLRTLRKEEVLGLKAYLALRSTGSFLAWGVGGLVAAIIAGSALYNIVAGWIKVVPK